MNVKMRSIKISFNLCGDIIFSRNCMKDASEKPQPIQWVMCLVQSPCVRGDTETLGFYFCVLC